MKTVKIKSAIPIYASALVWLVFGLCAPMYKWRYILLALGVSVVIYIVASIIFPGREEEVEAKANSGAFTEEIKTAINQSNVGDMFVFTAIQVRGNDGKTKTLETPIGVEIK